MTDVMHMLFVDDNPGDRDLAREALEESANTELHTAGDGEEAMEFLRRDGMYKNMPRPDCILLDLNMPRKGGLEVLREVKSDASLKAIPVIIFSSSTATEDLRQAYIANANAYVVKPSSLNEFLNILRQIEHFWRKVATVIP